LSPTLLSYTTLFRSDTAGLDAADQPARGDRCLDEPAELLRPADARVLYQLLRRRKRSEPLAVPHQLGRRRDRVDPDRARSVDDGRLFAGHPPHRTLVGCAVL